MGVVTFPLQYAQNEPKLEESMHSSKAKKGKAVRKLRKENLAVNITT